MAQEAPGIQNKWLLVIAAVLGLLVVVIFNVHINQVRNAAKGEPVRLVRFARDIEVGERVTRKDLEVVEVDQKLAAPLGNIVTEDQLNVADGVMSQSALKGNWFMWSFVLQDNRSLPSRRISTGKRAMTLDIDPTRAPGDILRPGDRVDVLGLLVVNNEAKTYRIIEGLKVLGIGGRGLRESTLERSKTAVNDEGQRTYRSLTVEIEPEISPQLADVLSRVVGSIWVEVRNPDESPKSEWGRVDSRLQKLTGVAKTRGGQTIE